MFNQKSLRKTHMHTTRTQTAICFEIICSFSIFFIDINNIVRFHYLPYLSGNAIIRNETKEIISAFSQNQEYRLFLDCALLLITFFWVFIKKQKIVLCYIFAFGIILRFVYWGYDSYINIIPLYKNNSAAADIIIGEWVKYCCWIIPFITAMSVLLYYIYTRILISHSDNHQQDTREPQL